MSDEPFGRQPQPVTVSLEGDKVDREEWLNKLMRYAANAGDAVSRIGSVEHTCMFRIYPRARND